jgi:hypothetical protein
VKERLTSNASFYKINVFALEHGLYTQYQGFHAAERQLKFAGWRSAKHVCKYQLKDKVIQLFSSSSSSLVAAGIRPCVEG